jgi:hypothetical protein
MTTRFVNHDMAGCDQIQEVVVHIKQAGGVGQGSPIGEGLDLRDAEKHCINPRCDMLIA